MTLAARSSSRAGKLRPRSPCRCVARHPQNFSRWPGHRRGRMRVERCCDDRSGVAGRGLPRGQNRVPAGRSHDAARPAGFEVRRGFRLGPTPAENRRRSSVSAARRPTRSVRWPGSFRSHPRPPMTASSRHPSLRMCRGASPWKSSRDAPMQASPRRNHCHGPGRNWRRSGRLTGSRSSRMGTTP